jgi:hypothetical protein
MGPSARWAASTNELTSADRVMSATWKKTPPVRVRRSAAAAASASASRPQMATLAPISASRVAIARPMPRLPPVTRAIAEESGAEPDGVMRFYALARVLSVQVRSARLDFFLVRTPDLCDTYLNNIRGLPVFHRVCDLGCRCVGILQLTGRWTNTRRYTVPCRATPCGCYPAFPIIPKFYKRGNPGHGARCITDTTPA